MLDLYDLLRNIEKRPAMYLGQPSISQLRAFLSGYFLAKKQMGTAESAQEKHFSNFQSWIEQKFSIASSQSWDKIILFFSQDEHKALERFFVLLEEYQKVMPGESSSSTSLGDKTVYHASL